MKTGTHITIDIDTRRMLPQPQHMSSSSIIIVRHLTRARARARRKVVVVSFRRYVILRYAPDDLYAPFSPVLCLARAGEDAGETHEREKTRSCLLYIKTLLLLRLN